MKIKLKQNMLSSLMGLPILLNSHKNDIRFAV